MVQWLTTGDKVSMSGQGTKILLRPWCAAKKKKNKCPWVVRALFCFRRERDILVESRAILTRLVIGLAQGTLRNRLLVSPRDSFSGFGVLYIYISGISVFERALRILTVALKLSPSPKGPAEVASVFLHSLLIFQHCWVKYIYTSPLCFYGAIGSFPPVALQRSNTVVGVQPKHCLAVADFRAWRLEVGVQ